MNNQEEYKKPLLLSFKWTVSKGKDTYGYNICSLYVDGSKVDSCMGGGYDMKGSVLGFWITKEFQDKLMLIQSKAHHIHTQKDNMSWEHETNKKGLYGLSLLRPKKLKPHMTIDGACGQSSVVEIAEQCGLTLTSTQTGRNDYGYFLTNY